MSSKKEEERNEKIIRGLLKLPPNRRCINCNSLGPQYVCTNFWTFVCMTCSGIHREFTHRVKSVSMSKFTSQEVESLQKGGNQRAREAYLNDWDPQRHRLPNSSNAEKVREFIKNVYVDRKYAGGKTSEKPPVDAQNLRHHEEETRRASSYHSYSQSPPYDYQYEERRYGRQIPALTRKPGSDRALYEGKFSNFSSPSRFSDQMLEDRFANEGSNPRASDYSVSSPGDPFSSGTQSPNFQRDTGFRSPPHQTTHIINKQVQKQTMISFLESNTKTDEERVHHPQRTRSSGSFGSFDSNSMSFKSVNSVSLADLVSEPHHSAETHQDKQYAVSSLPQSSGSGNFGGLDLFNTPFVPHTVTSASTIDLFQLPKAQSTPPLDLFEPSSTSSVPGPHAPQPSKTMPPSLDFFSEMPQQLPAATLDNKSKVVVIPKNEGWATFDLAQHTAPNVGVVHSETPGMPPNGGYLGKVDPLMQPSGGLQWPVFEDSNTHEPPSMHNLWHGGPYNSQVSVNATHTQSWDAFQDPTAHLPSSSTQRTGEEFSLHVPPIMDQHDFIKEGIQRTALDSRNPISSVPLHVNNGSSSAPSSISFVESQSQAADHRPTNPFDLVDDSDFGSSSMFLNMTSLEAALPSAQLQNSFLNDVSQPWFSHNPVTHYIPAAQQGFMAGQAPSTQMSNVPTQGPVASVGGNPFA